MRTLSKILLGTSGVVAASLLATKGHAQSSDIDPPAPNVLLLIDTSGSMERTIAGTEPVCVPMAPAPPEDQKSRWAVLVEALTGPIQDFSCLAQSRSDAAFVSEFTLGTTAPYDRDYYIPFHRLLSSGCTKGPGVTDDTLKEHLYSGVGDACGTAWTQLDSGLLDTYRDRIRFALMTFDTLPSAGTGWSGSANYSSGVAGMWSYFLSWESGGSPAQGRPAGCPTLQDLEVGARNPAAPLWEGPLVPFADYAAPLADVRATNDRIQDALVAMRPYGATPLAGMLADARDYLLNDTSTWNGKPLGPKDDPYSTAGCRGSTIILISDGEPNLDLRPECAAGPGSGPDGTGCPYLEPHVIAADLANHPDPVRTFVIGFGLRELAKKEAGDVDVCDSFTTTDFSGTGKCVGATGALKACCTLARIAIEGETEQAYFPENTSQLKTMMDSIIADLDKSTSRTLPVFATATATAGGTDADAVAYQFAASFAPSNSGNLWQGNLRRKRYVCESVNGVLTPVLKDVKEDLGDDFAVNLTKKDAAQPRRFFTVVGTYDAGAQRIWSGRSIRPAVTSDDGLGVYSGAVTGSGALQDPTAFANDLKGAPHALDLDPSAPVLPSQCSAGLLATSAAECAERIVKWEVGEPGVPSTDLDRAGEELGSIYHATPAVVGPPREAIADESYALFAQQQAKRPIVLYAATTDGQLHAFQVARSDTTDTLKVDKAENNELWSFLPPHVLPRLLPTFNQQAFLLDGTPVVQNIIFERTLNQAVAAGSGTGAAWRTVLLASGGAGGSFYYALDVTDPKQPEFLWQISTDAGGVPLFGDAPPTPAMAMVELDTGTEVKEVAVAILPGGSSTLGAGACARKGSATPMFNPTGTLAVRASVRCWGGAAIGDPVGPSRSVTIVRLDTGEVLRTFRGDVAESPPGLAAKTTVADFDSPMTGIPVPFPSQPGQVADRVYIGDADGTMWRIGLSKPKPDDWTADLAWDAYSFTTDTAADGQPIDTVPVVSLDPLGNKVILFSTGDQELFTTSGTLTRVWSLTEKPFSGSFRFSENWVVPLTDGKRVTGPISLFNGVAYFSTFTPTPPAVYQCADGFGSIWGVDYAVGTAAVPAAYPLPRLIPDLSNPTLEHFQDEDPGTMVFGVAVTQTPTCVETETFNDPFYGPVPELSTGPNAGTTFQLVYQAPKTNDPIQQDTAVPIKTIELQPPSPTVRIDSWASVIE